MINDHGHDHDDRDKYYNSDDDHGHDHDDHGDGDDGSQEGCLMIW